MDLESVRDSLIRQEDTIIFSLIERAKFPINSQAYASPQYGFDVFPAPSFLHFFVRESEALHAKAGRYENPEENPFFPDDLPPSMVPTNDYNNKQVLHPSGSSININKTIWDLYVNELLPLVASEGDDGNYAQTAASDLACLQAISRRIHYGKFVAEVKFTDAPDEYGPAIRNKEREALMKMLTFEAVEETVKKRVEKKAMVFGQEVSLSNDKENKQNHKIDPSVVGRLYKEWVMPLTKQVQVEYLLRRLD